jgi:hypothetical protein
MRPMWSVKHLMWCVFYVTVKFASEKNVPFNHQFLFTLLQRVFSSTVLYNYDIGSIWYCVRDKTVKWKKSEAVYLPASSIQSA